MKKEEVVFALVIIKPRHGRKNKPERIRKKKKDVKTREEVGMESLFPGIKV